jgi:hypothetical protein
MAPQPVAGYESCEASGYARKRKGAREGAFALNRVEAT